MSNNTDNRSMSSQPYAELALLRLELKKQIFSIIQDLDPSLPDTLAFSTAALLEVHCRPKDLENLIGTSQTTISRWAKGQTIPRSQGYRRWCVETMRTFLAQEIGSGLPEGLIAVRGPNTNHSPLQRVGLD